MNFPPKPERIYFWDLPKDAFEAFLDLRNQLEAISIVELTDADRSINDTSTDLIALMKSQVDKFPMLVNAIDEADRSFLALCIRVVHFTIAYAEDEACFTPWLDAMKWLIEKNPYSLVWLCDVTCTPNALIDESPLEWICREECEEFEPLLIWITRYYVWIFRCVEHNFMGHNNKRIQDPHFELLMYHTHGVVPASAVQHFCELFPEALASTSYLGSITLLYLSLLVVDQRVCCSSLFKWIAQQAPEAMMHPDGLGCNMLPLHMACVRLTSHGGLDPTLEIHQDSIPDLTEICLFLISECPEAIFVEDSFNRTPLHILHIFGRNKPEVNLVIIAMIKAIHELSPGSLLAQQCCGLVEPLSEWYSDAGKGFLWELDFTVGRQALLRQEALLLLKARASLAASSFSAVVEGYMCWSSQRLKVVKAFYLLFDSSEIDVLLQLFFPSYKDPALTWDEYRYNPFEDWASLHSDDQDY